MTINYNGQARMITQNPQALIDPELPAIIFRIVNCALDLSLVQYITEYIDPITGEQTAGYTEVHIQGVSFPITVIEDYEAFKVLL